MPLTPWQYTVCQPHWRLPGHSQASLKLSLLWCHCSLFWVPGAHKFVCTLQESVSPVLCKFCHPSHWPSKSDYEFSVRLQIPRLGTLLWALELSQQCKNFFSINCFPVCRVSAWWLYVGAQCHASQVCFSHSTCPHSRPLLTHASQEILKHSKRQIWLSLLALGPGAHRFLVEPLEHLWVVVGFGLNALSPLQLSC